jgi:hypothetical protein
MKKAAKKPSSPSLKRYMFSHPHFIAFILIFALIGGYAIWQAFAFTVNEVALNGNNASASNTCPGWTAASPTVSNTARPVFEIAGDGNRASYQAFLDGNDIGTYSVSNAPFADVCVLTPLQSALSDGNHSFFAREISPTAGQLTVPNPLTFTVDTTPPSTPAAPTMASFSDSGIAGDAITRFGNPSFSGTADANTAIFLYINGGAGFGGASVDATGHWSARVTTLASGTYTLTIVASDQAGNLSPQSNPLSIKIDTAAPTNPSITPASGTPVSGIVDVSATATDSISGLWKVDFQIDSGTIQTDTSSPYNYSWNTTGLAIGSIHTITATIYDLV